MSCSSRDQLPHNISNPADTLRILSYNIHHGEGMDKVLDLERIALLIKRINPDLVALQEVDSVTRSTDGVDQASKLGQLTGLKPLFSRFMYYDSGSYGMALLSRWHITKWENLRLPDGSEPRTSLSAIVTSPKTGRSLRFIGIHFYETEEERLAQAKRLEEYLVEKDLHTILAGDFNSLPDSKVITNLAASWQIATKGKDHFTFPSYKPDTEIDYILLRPLDGFEVLNHWLVDEPIISDHRPIVIDLVVQD